MRFNLIKSLIPLVVLAVVVMAWMNRRPGPPVEHANRRGRNSVIALDPSCFLIKPYFDQADQVAVALDGGNVPVPRGQVPSLIVGNNVLRIVHLAWVHDWTDPQARASFHTLQALYASEKAASLPAVKIHLNPVFSDSRGESVHRAMLQVFFRSDNRGLYQVLAKELAAGTLAADPEAIRSRVKFLEPLLMDDWNSELGWLEGDIGKTFSVAKTQQARNAGILKPAFKSQLVSMLEILNPSADEKEFGAFIQQANTVQRTWLRSPLGDENGKR